MGIGLDVDLFDAAADGEDFRDTADALQAAFDSPVGEGAQVHRGDGLVLVAEADQQDFAHQGRDGSEAGFGGGGQGIEDGLQALLDQLPGAVDIRAPGEFSEDEGEADIGVGAQAVQSADALDGAFNRLGNEGFHFLRREAGTFRQDGDGRLGHVRQDFDGQLRGGVDAEDQQQQGGTEDQRALAEGESDEGVEHGAGGEGEAQLFEKA